MNRDRHPYFLASAATLFLASCLIVEPVRAAPITHFVHTLSSSEITPLMRGSLWTSPVFAFGETVVLANGDTLNLRIEFAGSQFLEFGDSGLEQAGIGPSNGVFTRTFILGGPWTFNGVSGNLLLNDVGVSISNSPILVVGTDLVNRGESVRFTGVDLALTGVGNVGGERESDGSLSLDGIFLSLAAGPITIGGSANQVPEPSGGWLVGLGALLVSSLRRRIRSRS